MNFLSGLNSVKFIEDDGSCPLARKYLDGYGFLIPDMWQDISFETKHMRVKTIMNVYDRDTGDLANIHNKNLLKGCEYLFAQGKHEKVMKFLRLELIRLMAHEVDEQIQVSGVRVFDPHLRKYQLSTAFSE